jgi:hypothetical protein
LPTAAHAHVGKRERRLARPAGLEPATLGLEGRCSIQLSYGRLRVKRALNPAIVPGWRFGIEAHEVSAGERAALDRREEARDARIREAPILSVAWSVTSLSHQWFKTRLESVSAESDPVLAEALAIARYDAALVTGKLHRALHGRDESEEDGEGGIDPIQSDWIGSAKVALISIERSEAAWRVIAQATGEPAPGAIADQLQDLRELVEHAFPHARAFVRPGFDEPGR